jgi:hypothetical protein
MDELGSHRLVLIGEHGRLIEDTHTANTIQMRFARVAFKRRDVLRLYANDVSLGPPGLIPEVMD